MCTAARVSSSRWSLTKAEASARTTRALWQSLRRRRSRSVSPVASGVFEAQKVDARAELGFGHEKGAFPGADFELQRVAVVEDGCARCRTGHVVGQQAISVAVKLAPSSHAGCGDPRIGVVARACYAIGRDSRAAGVLSSRGQTPRIADSRVFFRKLESSYLEYRCAEPPPGVDGPWRLSLAYNLSLRWRPSHGARRVLGRLQLGRSDRLLVFSTPSACLR